MALRGDIKAIGLLIVVLVVVVIGSSVYFGLTTPVGQQSLAGSFGTLGTDIINMFGSLFAPITAIFNGLAKAITNFFSHLIP
jgi:uncharacterized membrane protein